MSSHIVNIFKSYTWSPVFAKNVSRLKYFNIKRPLMRLTILDVVITMNKTSWWVSTFILIKYATSHYHDYNTDY